jgi:hypothetical protein
LLIHFQDISLMSKAIEQRAGQMIRTEHAGHRRIGHDDAPVGELR